MVKEKEYILVYWYFYIIPLSPLNDLIMQKKKKINYRPIWEKLKLEMHDFVCDVKPRVVFLNSWMLY